MIKVLNDDFERLGVLRNIISAKRTEELDGENTLEFEAVLDEKSRDFIDENSIFELDGDYFDIAFFSKNAGEDGLLTIEVEAEHVSYRLNSEAYIAEYFTEIGTPLYVLNQILSGTGFSADVVEFSASVTYSAQEQKTKRQLVLELAALLGGEAVFNQFAVSIVRHRGESEAKAVLSGRNVKVLSKSLDKRRLNEQGAPTATYSCEPLYLPNDSYALGDEVMLVQGDLDIREALRVVKLSYNPYDRANTTIRLANYSNGLADSLYRIQTSTVAKDKLYNGIRIGPEYGFEAVRSDKRARSYFRSDGLVMQSGDGSGENWRDRLYYAYDSALDQTVLVYDGVLSADVLHAVSDVITPYVYSDNGAIVNAIVSRLRTDLSKPFRYLQGDTSDVRYQDIGDTDRRSGRYFELDYCLSDLPPVQFSMPAVTGKSDEDVPLWWFEGQVGGSMTTNSAYAIAEAGADPVPVMVYQYETEVLHSINAFILEKDDEESTADEYGIIERFGQGRVPGDPQRGRGVIQRTNDYFSILMSRGEGAFIGGMRIGLERGVELYNPVLRKWEYPGGGTSSARPPLTGLKIESDTALTVTTAEEVEGYTITKSGARISSISDGDRVLRVDWGDDISSDNEEGFNAVALSAVVARGIGGTFDKRFIFKVNMDESLIFSFYNNDDPIATSCTVDWGDGTASTITSDLNNLTHTYAVSGEYTIIVDGVFPGMILPGSRVAEVVNWGDVGKTSASSMFSSCNLLTKLPDGPITGMEKVTSFTYCFSYCTNLISIPDNIFANCVHVTTFSGCFSNCSSFVSIPAGLFTNCTAVMDFSYCFNYCTNLISIPENIFVNNTSVTMFIGCFGYCSSLVSIPAGLFNSNAAGTNFAACFINCSNLASIPADLFVNCTAVTNFQNCFRECTSLTSTPEGLFANNIAATNFNNCFRQCTSLISIPADLFAKCTSVTGFSYCFYECYNLASIPAGIFDACAVVTTFSYCFGYCTSLAGIPAGLFDKCTEVVSFDRCFINCTDLTAVPSGLFINNTAVTAFNSCFNKTRNLVIGDNVFNLAALSDKQPNFSGCFAVDSQADSHTGTVQDIWNYVAGYTNGLNCFFRCTALTNYSDIPPTWGGTFESVIISGSGSVSFQVPNASYYDGVLEYSHDGITWSDYTATTTIAGTGQLYLRGTGNTKLSGMSSALVLTGNDLKIDGCIFALLDYEKVRNKEQIVLAEGVFRGTFSGQGITSLGNYLLYHNNVVMATDCYHGTFSSNQITSLEGFVLSSTVLASGCYQSMFYNNQITSLEGFALPATTLVAYCYSSMFANNRITSLGSFSLPARTLNIYCCANMFQNNQITSLDGFALPATTLVAYCYVNMFTNNQITSLEGLTLTVNRVAANCCQQMFAYNQITSLKGFELPAMALVSGCYKSMFSNNQITALEGFALPATTLAGSCYESMFSNNQITSLEGFTLPTTTLVGSCYKSMFSNNQITSLEGFELPATTLVTYCYQYMFQNNQITSLEGFALPATTLATYCYQYMFQNNQITSLEGFELPATTLATHCYSAMFQLNTNANGITVRFTAYSPSNATQYWFSGVTASGNFHCPAALPDTTGASARPTSWTRIADQ